MRRTILVLLVVLFSMSHVWGQSAGPVKVIYPKRVGSSLALRDIPPVPEYNGLARRVIPNQPSIYEGQGTGAYTLDPVLQSSEGPRTFGPPVQNFEGVTTGSNPPDTNGEVGLSHYVQTVNTQYGIWDKSGTLLLGPSPLNTVFTGFGGSCEFTNSGDPITLYDQLADRWVLSQFTAPGGASATQCFAVSKTADPTGEYWLYEFPTPGNDYPKLSVWDDQGGSQSSYLAGIRNFSGGFNFDAYAVERDVMLSGGTGPALVVFNLSALVPGANNFLPADIEGFILPPTGTAVPWVGVDNPVTVQDELEMLELEVDWATPSNSTLTRLPDVPVAAFDGNVCFFSRNCIPQPGTSNKVDGFADAMMFRAPYRNFGTHQSFVCTHTVDVGDFSDHAGIRWHELRNAGAANGAWTLHQESTYSPDSDHRWMPSISINQNGDMMVGYSVSSSTTFPSIRYAGRLVGDPLNQLTFAEGLVVAGTGSQTSSMRWGDYHDMSVDPSDDLTFWYTAQYQSGAGNAKNTRIASFTADTAPPLVDIKVTPSVPVPVIIPAGGLTLDMVVTVDNNGSSTLNAQVWNTVSIEGNEVGPVGGLGVTNINVPAGGQFSTTFSNFEFPAGLRPDSFIFNWKVGTFPNVQLDRALFVFIKSAGPTFTKAGGDDWGLGPVQEVEVPEAFTLEQNYPNPFNPSTRIRYGLDKQTHVKLSIYNTLGQEVVTLVDGVQDAGFQTVSWNGTDNLGQQVSAGVYVYRLEAGNNVQIKKMTFAK